MATNTPSDISYPYTYSDQVSSLLNTTPHNILKQNPHLTNLLVGAFVFNRDGKILLVRRAKTEDIFPDLWEVPGGGFEQTDPTLLHTVARELYEETGFTAAHIPFLFRQLELTGPTSGSHWMKYDFLVEIDFDRMRDPVATLNDKEHCEFGWFSRSAVLGEEKDKDVIEISRNGMEFTTEDMRRSVCIAFDLVEERKKTTAKKRGKE